ncbi:MAG: hypothetical protein A3H93_12950 [Rhodocyclales bacterium RIFCSPLOWO2_02_FULL_63_24]|nr:MAG: hypothetical protein A2040_16325 [Rhodocyclales bacterium GWA2_65_19]OHC68906.1 MAG: hypothetical protein A3H93_12950 [Rhodocyclales bacterium RIFCSPLOWO2_02_FULL_63_24]
MQKAALAAIVIILGGGLAAYYFMQKEAPPPAPPPQQTIPRSPVPAAPAVVAPVIRHPLAGVAAAALPELEQSDAPVLQALGELLGRKWLAFILTDGVIQRIVATVDNLPRERLPVGVMPLKPVPKAFITTGEGATLAIGPRNSARYAPYVRVVGAVDAAKLVALYVRFYPLFQRAYEELGYPKAYFNDRLVEAIDNLVAAPELSAPIKLVRPMVLYEFADPKLEARSAGQKIMIRMGRDNAAAVKAKLHEIRRLVATGA